MDALETTPSPEQPARPQGSDRSFRVWDKLLGSTPVVLTVLATVLAGLSSAEMTRAQYFRAPAAQYQSKVSDQWNFFQANAFAAPPWKQRSWS